MHWTKYANKNYLRLSYITIKSVTISSAALYMLTFHTPNARLSIYFGGGFIQSQKVIHENFQFEGGDEGIFWTQIQNQNSQWEVSIRGGEGGFSGLLSKVNIIRPKESKDATAA